MIEIAHLKKKILQSVFKNKLSESELEVYSELTDINVFDGDNFIQTHNDGRLFFILKGSVQIKSETNESVVSLSSGFLGLSNLFPNILWQKYRIFSTSGLKVFYLDISILSSLINKYPALEDYFYRQAINLDLLLLHHYETANLPSEKVDLASQISSLSILSLESGVHEASMFIKDKSYLILHIGQLIHSSGRQLSPGKVYKCSSLPNFGEWMNLSETHLFCDDREQLNTNSSLLNSSHQQCLEAGRHHQAKTINSQSIVEISYQQPEAISIKHEKPKQHFGQRCTNWVQKPSTNYLTKFRYILLFLICFVAVIVFF